MLDNKTTEEHFSRKAVDEEASKHNSNKFNKIMKLLKPKGSILECGAGAGFYTKEFLKRNYQVTAIDLSEQALKTNKKQAKSQGKELTTHAINFTDFKTKEKYDQIIFIKVFHHFDTLTNIYNALDHARTLLKTDGKIIIFEPNGKNPLWKPILSLRKDKGGKTKWFYEQNMKYTTKNNFNKYFKKHNLNYQLQYHYIIPSVLLNKLPFLNKLNNYLEKTFLKKLAFNFSIIYSQQEHKHQ
jgi:cyclopropane fatty-acyl-phospholipid synthase-like methyltransferase